MYIFVIFAHTHTHALASEIWMSSIYTPGIARTSQFIPTLYYADDLHFWEIAHLYTYVPALYGVQLYIYIEISVDPTSLCPSRIVRWYNTKVSRNDIHTRVDRSMTGEAMMRRVWSMERFIPRIIGFCNYIYTGTVYSNVSIYEIYRTSAFMTLCRWCIFRIHDIAIFI